MLQYKKELSFARDFNIWDSNPELMNIQVSNVEFSPSVHHISSHIVHIVGQSIQVNTDAPNQIVFVLYNDVEPFDEVARFHTSRDNFDGCSLAMNRSKQEDFFIAVLFTFIPN